ncbi:hypothetical protein F4779DRAFT_598651 [Xylariaceae sp. FL0662B]|nr:hypothetical protein F4779DRAFT_598651 [Xylariaceae sp. FL0662B]
MLSTTSLLVSSCLLSLHIEPQESIHPLQKRRRYCYSAISPYVYYDIIKKNPFNPVSIHNNEASNGASILLENPT